MDVVKFKQKKCTQIYSFKYIYIYIIDKFFNFNLIKLKTKLSIVKSNRKNK